MKKLLVLLWMHLSLLGGITLFIIEHKVSGGDALQLYLGYLPFWLIPYKELEAPAHRTAAIVISAALGIACLVAAFYFHAYFLLCVTSVFCAIGVPLVQGKKVAVV